MARRRTKKERKKHLKEDQFRDSMLSVGKQVKEYRYLILLAAAVVVLLFVLLSMRARRRQDQISHAADLIKRGALVGPEELKDLSEKVKGEPIEPWILLRYGAKLYELYQKEDALKGDKVRLEEAKKIFEHVRKDFADNGSAAFFAREALQVIEKEQSYDMPENIRKAYERKMAPPRKPATPPIKTPRIPPPKKPDTPKSPQEQPVPEKTEGNESPGKPESPPEKKPEPSGDTGTPDKPEPPEPDNQNK